MFTSVPMAAPQPMAYVPQQPSAPMVPAAQPRPQNPMPAVPAASSRPQPLIRAQAPEEPNPARPPLLTMPSPEQLGVALRPTESGPDWAAIHARITELGIETFRMDSLADGRARFTCWVPRGQPGLTQCIEAVAATKAEAVQLALEQAARTRAGQP